jgi:hypothetical protein
MGFQCSRRVLRRFLLSYCSHVSSPCKSVSIYLVPTRGYHEGFLRITDSGISASCRKLASHRDFSHSLSWSSDSKCAPWSTSVSPLKPYCTEARTDESVSAQSSYDSSGAAEVAARGWQITDETESDWRGHAAAIARSIQLMKTRMVVLAFSYFYQR